MNDVDNFGALLGVVREPDEDDAHLRMRILWALHWPEKTRNTKYLQLCLLLARLGISHARRDLPVVGAL
jgi:hypothetical protein